MAQAATRVYFVTEEGKQGERMIDAGSQSEAIDIASARTKFTARVPKQRELVEALRAGRQIEYAPETPTIDQPDGQQG